MKVLKYAQSLIEKYVDLYQVVGTRLPTSDMATIFQLYRPSLTHFPAISPLYAVSVRCISH